MRLFPAGIGSMIAWKMRDFEIKLSHPLTTKAIASAKVKTDRVDSTTLAHLLRSDLLPLSYVPEKPARLNRALLRYRARYIQIIQASLWRSTCWGR